jgi:hypothetical protein
MNPDDTAGELAGTGTHGPDHSGSGMALTPPMKPAVPAGTQENARYRLVLRSCGDINDQGHWAASRSFW